MNVVILTPILVEHQAILAHLTNLSEKVIGSSRYVLAHFDGLHGPLNIITQQTGSGNSTLALAAEKAIHQFQPALIILAGVAGGVKDVAIGDVVVGTKYYGYESGKETETGFVARPEAGHYSKELQSVAQSVSASPDWRARSKNAALAKVVFGPIAGGDKVIAATESAIYRLLKQSYNDTTAIEMEAIGFAQALAHYPAIRFANIRGVSDLLGGKTHADSGGSQERAAENMAAFIFELLYQLDISQFKMIGSMELKELAKQVVDMILPIAKLDAAKEIGEDFKEATNGTLRELWKKVKPLFIEEYEALKKDPDDSDTQAEARVALRKALNGKDDLKEELEKLLAEAKKTEGGGVTISNSKNVIQGSNINVGGNFHLGDNNTTTNQHTKNDEVGRDKYQSESINIHHHYAPGSPPTNPSQDNHAGNPQAENTPKSASAQSWLDFISSGNPEAAIKAVVQFTATQSKDYHSEAIGLSARWNDLERRKRIGAIKNDDASIERSQIVNALLSLIDLL